MSSPRTLNELYFQGLESHARPNAFRVKRDGAYRDISSAGFLRAAAEISLGLVALGLERGERIALLSEARVEWGMVDMGVLTAGLVSVPIYPTLLSGAIEYILENADCKVLFVSDREQAKKVADYRRTHPDLRVVLIEGEAAEGLLPLRQLRERGAQLGGGDPELHRKRAAGVRAEDLATIIYTSGTTGRPKGVMLTHGNITSNVLSCLQLLPLGEQDASLSFLPLSHIFERMGGLYVMVYAGVSIAYAESIETVPENLRETRPTVVTSVPRLYEKMYARVLDAASAGGALRQSLFFWARRIGLARTRRILAGKPVRAALACRYALAKKLVFAKLRRRTGGRMRFFISGGAPLAREIAEFFHAAGLPILEGYGLTESSPVITLNTDRHMRLGTVGKPVPGVEVKIAEDGEILARGPNIMQGYYRMPEETEEALRDGWLHTGDIGHLDSDGYLVITDRKKDLLVTAGGKNVAPQPIENALRTDRFISNAVVLGDRRPCLVALVVPDFDQLESYARIKKIAFRERSELVLHPRIQDLIRRRIARHQTDTARYELIRAFHLLDRDLTIENDEITPTLKVRRKVVEDRFRKEIDALYLRGGSREEAQG